MASFTPEHLKFLNAQLALLEPQKILEWASITLPNLYQTTALGLTGLVSLDMLSKIGSPVPLIFIDTLYHFPETLDLVQQVREKYPAHQLHVYTPDGLATTAEFEKKHGEKFWERDEATYDYLVKVEPARRAYAELNIKAVLTGRRRSQGGRRGDLDVIEIDETGIIKINPLANWTFSQVEEYIRNNNVPHNVLLDQGYRSVGDWHSTKPVKEGEDERAGRWAGREKTECGLHMGYLEQKIAAKKAMLEQQSRRRASHGSEK